MILRWERGADLRLCCCCLMLVFTEGSSEGHRRSAEQIRLLVGLSRVQLLPLSLEQLSRREGGEEGETEGTNSDPLSLAWLSPLVLAAGCVELIWDQLWTQSWSVTSCRTLVQVWVSKQHHCIWMFNTRTKGCQKGGISSPKFNQLKLFEPQLC